MRAVVLPAYGPASSLELRTVDDPKPGPGEIAVRMAGAGVNPIDWKQRGGAYHAYFPLEFPAILGRDVSGTVAAVGLGVSAFAAGDGVLGWVPGRAYAEIVVAPVDCWARVPPNMDLANAGALPLVLLTGAQLAEEAIDARAGQTVLVTGATGAVGRVAVYAAKARGAKVLAGVRAKRKAEAGALGADAVVALDDDNELAALPELDAIADTVGGATIAKLAGKIKNGGKLGSVVGPPQNAGQLADRAVTVRPILTHRDPKRLADLAAAVADGKLAIPIARRFPLAEAAAAQELAEKGAEGKVLLVG